MCGYAHHTVATWVVCGTMEDLEKIYLSEQCLSAGLGAQRA